MNIGWRELSMTRTRVRSAWGHVSGGPRDVVVQSWARMRAPMSPPPRKADVTELMDLSLPLAMRHPQLADEVGGRGVPALGDLTADPGRARFDQGDGAGLLGWHI